MSSIYRQKTGQDFSCPFHFAFGNKRLANAPRKNTGRIFSAHFLIQFIIYFRAYKIHLYNHLIL